jgi:hypothetical protein
MSMRSGWKYGGKHFAETHTERGGQRYFVDGKPMTKRDWGAALATAKAEDEKTGRDPKLSNDPKTTV